MFPQSSTSPTTTPPTTPPMNIASILQKTSTDSDSDSSDSLSRQSSPPHWGDSISRAESHSLSGGIFSSSTMSPYSTSISNSKSNSSASPYSPPSSPLSPTITSPSSYMSVEQVLTKVAPGCITCDITGNIRIVDPPDEYYCCSLCRFEGGRCFQATDENNDSKGVHDDGNSNYKTRSSSNSNSSSININIDPFATCKNLLLNKNSCHYTMCEVSKHNTIESCWILAGNKIFDVTDFLMNHPGGIRSMLRYSGGVKDCTDDMNFHSRKSIKLWVSERSERAFWRAKFSR